MKIMDWPCTYRWIFETFKNFENKSSIGMNFKMKSEALVWKLTLNIFKVTEDFSLIFEIIIQMNAHPGSIKYRIPTETTR